MAIDANSKVLVVANGDLEKVMKGLAELPWKDSNELLNALVYQANNQMAILEHVGVAGYQLKTEPELDSQSMYEARNRIGPSHEPLPEIETPTLNPQTAGEDRGTS